MFKNLVKIILNTILVTQSSRAFGSDFPRVDEDLKFYDNTVAEKNAAFDKIPVDLMNIPWVKAKLSHMFDVDQFMRKFSRDIPFQHNYSADETKYFQEKFSPNWNRVDSENTSDLKDLLKIYSWFTVSKFGGESDMQAWLLVQHADHDPDFQKKILTILEPLYPSGETDPTHYAYLFDRVAASWHDQTQRKLQRFGTQGQCTGPGTWEPIPVEDPTMLDARRKSVGLGPEADYIASFKNICHQAE